MRQPIGQKCLTGNTVRVEQEEPAGGFTSTIIHVGLYSKVARLLSDWTYKPEASRDQEFPLTGTLSWVELAILASGQVNLSFVGHLISEHKSDNLISLIEHIVDTYYDEHGRLNLEGADVLCRCWDFVKGQIELDDFISVPETVWLFLDYNTRDDLADAARSGDIWTTNGHMLLDHRKYLERNWKKARKTWFGY